MQFECQVISVESRRVAEDVLRDGPEQPAHVVHLLPCTLKLHAEPGVHILVEMLQQDLPGLVHPRTDRRVHLLAQLAEARLDLLGRAALLVDVRGCASRSRRPTSIEPSTSSDAPKTPSNRLNFSSSSSRTRRSASFRSFRKLSTTTSCFWP